MGTETVTVAQARSDFSNLLAQAELLGRRFVIARRGKPKAALVSVKDLARLEALERAVASASPDLATRRSEHCSRLACYGQ